MLKESIHRPVFIAGMFDNVVVYFLVNGSNKSEPVKVLSTFSKQRAVDKISNGCDGGFRPAVPVWASLDQNPQCFLVG